MKFRIVAILLATSFLAGCQSNDGVRASVSIPLGKEGKFGSLDVGIGYTPPPSLYALADAPRPLSLSDFKEVLR